MVNITLNKEERVGTDIRYYDTALYNMLVGTGDIPSGVDGLNLVNQYKNKTISNDNTMLSDVLKEANSTTRVHEGRYYAIRTVSLLVDFFNTKPNYKANADTYKYGLAELVREKMAGYYVDEEEADGIVLRGKIDFNKTLQPHADMDILTAISILYSTIGFPAAILLIRSIHTLHRG